MKKIYLTSIGCKVNYAETSFLTEKFENEGYAIQPEPDLADFMIFNTCTVTHRADADSRKIIRSAIRKNPKLKVIVTGCAATTDKEQFKQIEGVVAVIDNSQKMQIPNYVKELSFDILSNTESEILIPTHSCETNLPFDISYTSENDTRTRAFLKLQDGCEYTCTYCIIPKARGNFRSMEFEKIIPTLHKLQQTGYPEVVLVGINLSEYNYDNRRFVDVIKVINDSDLDLRVRISSIEPNVLNKEIIKEISSSKLICPHFHLPLQSGSDSVLKAMQRRYNTQQFRDKVELIRQFSPDAGIGLDVITGFPTEGNNEFEETYNFINDLPISYLHVFSYSDRKGTVASQMKIKVNENEKKIRTHRLIELGKKKYLEFAESQIGKEKEVIVERTNEKNEFSGHTENYLEVIGNVEKNNNERKMKITLISLINEKIFSKINNLVNA